MKTILRFLTATSLRFRYITLLLVVVVLIAGGIAVSELKQELLPPVEFPQTIILAQVSGQTSDQVLRVVTERLEAALDNIPEIVNLESTTTGAFGAVITARNDFGVNQARLLTQIQNALDQVWMPVRRIEPPQGQAAAEFSATLLADLTAAELIYIAERDPNFLFQLTPQVWLAFSDQTVTALLAYLAQQVEETASDQDALKQLVNQELVPKLDALAVVGNINVSGGQVLPGDEVTVAAVPSAAEAAQVSLLTQLSPEVWTVAGPKAGQTGQLNDAAIAALQRVEVAIPASAPPLPASWQTNGFSTVRDLLEIRTLTTSAAGILNRFYTDGKIVGALGQTDDLTPDIVRQLLDIEPTLVEYLKAEHLVVLSPEVFDALPDTFVAGLDGFTRDALAAAALAQAITGQTVTPQPVNLPNQWRINPPQLITFSFADLPLATFSISQRPSAQVAAPTQTPTTDTPTTPEQEQATLDPAVLVPLLSQLGNLFGAQEAAPLLGDAWNTLASQPQFADRRLRTTTDLIAIGEGSAARVLNAINSGVPQDFKGYEVRLFDSLTPEVLAYFADNEPGFYSALDADVLRKFSPAALAALPEEVLASLDSDLAAELRAIASGQQESAFASLQALYIISDAVPADPNAPVLNPEWASIANFLAVELDSADDLLRLPETTAPNAAAFLNSIPGSPGGPNFARSLLGNLSVEAFSYVAEREDGFVDNLSLEVLQLLSDQVAAILPESAQERLADGGEVFIPTSAVTRINGSPSLLLTVFKTRDANTVQAYQEVEAVIRQIQQENPDLVVTVAFEQASFIQESITGVAREGSLGAVFAMIIILLFLSGGRWPRSPRRVAGLALIGLFALALGLLVIAQLDAVGGDLALAFATADVVLRVLFIAGIFAGIGVLIWPGDLPLPAWRATLVIGISIPLSLLSAFAVMRWLVPVVNQALQPLVDTSPVFAFLIRLFPENLTLNIMTLSGMTVAIGRVVDDSIVILENIFRHIQSGGDKKTAILNGASEVAPAILVATSIAVVVFLPLGLTGGLIGEFFLPFGLAVTYALLSSYLVAIIVVPVLVMFFISVDDAPEDADIWLARYYVPVLRWALSSTGTKALVVGLAILSFFLSVVLFGGRPAAFLPDFGEPQVSVNVSMPAGTHIAETNDYVERFEAVVRDVVAADDLRTIQANVGGGGLNFETLLTGGGINENRASITIGLTVPPDRLDSYAQRLRVEAEQVFGSENVVVSAASLSEQGFGGFALVVSGPQDDLVAANASIIAAIESVDGITNVTSNLPNGDTAGDASTSYIRVDRQNAVRYTGELETDNTIGVAQQAITAINALPDLPATLTVSQGFESEIQTEGFLGLFVAMGLAVMIVIGILVFALGSPIYWLAIIFSIVVAPVGAAIALTLADELLNISAMIGLLMLLGLVITNAVVLIDRVRQNMNLRNMEIHDAIIEAGGRRLRPILMTALATIIALIPLAIGLSDGAIIAAQLGIVVIGGVFSSTLLTLLVVPVVYSGLGPIHRAVMGVIPVGNGRRARRVQPHTSGTD